MPEEIKTLSLDVKTGEFLINGKKQKNVTYMQLTFDSGEWGLAIKQHRLYGASGKAASRDTAVTVRE